MVQHSSIAGTGTPSKPSRTTSPQFRGSAELLTNVLLEDFEMPAATASFE